MVKSIPDQNNKADMIGTGPIRFGTFSPAPDRQYIFPRKPEIEKIE